MHLIETELNDVKIVAPQRHGDDRGWFSETFCDSWFREHVADVGFLQDNHSKSSAIGTLRGLHFQRPPSAQAKLVRCVAGAIWDVALDIRKSSPDYGRWTVAELNPENGKQLYIPVGFAHGFITLRPNTEVVYKCSDYYAPECDGGIIWNDPELAIPWPIDGDPPTVSQKDTLHPLFHMLGNPFN